MGIRDFLNKILSKNEKLSIKESLRLFGDLDVRFTAFGNDIYNSDIVRSCIRPIAEATSKLSVSVNRDTLGGIKEDAENKRLQRLISQKPNQYMNGKDFLYKARMLYEIYNNAFIFIDKDINGFVMGLYPVPYSSVELMEYENGLYFIFDFKHGQRLAAVWDDVAVLRQDYATDLIFGDSNKSVLLPQLELIHTTNEGISNVVKTSANLKGILKSTKGMLDGEDLKKARDDFVKDYLNLENESGIASLDATTEYIPLSTDGKMVNSAQMKELRENVYRYFGVNDKIIMSMFNESEWEAFYDNKIEPFAIALSLELTNKCFTEHERGFGNKIVFEGNRLLYASTATKLQLAQLVDRSLLTDAEFRQLFGLPSTPIIGTMRIRKEYAETDKLNQIQGVGDDKKGLQEGNTDANK